MNETSKASNDRINVIIGLLGLIVAVISAIPGFMALGKDEPILYYSKSSYQVILPEGIDRSKVLGLLSRNLVPHGKLELQLINKGDGASSVVKIRIQTKARIKYLTTMPGLNDKVAWIEIGKSEVFELDSSMVATQELNNFSVEKTFIFQTWFEFDSLQNIESSNFNENIQLYYDGKPAIEVVDINAVPEFTLISRFKLPLVVLLATFVLSLLLALVRKIIRDPEFGEKIFTSFVDSTPFFGLMTSASLSVLSDLLTQFSKKVKDKDQTRDDKK